MKRGLYLLTMLIVSATAYCLPGTTASGEPVREGICAGGSKFYGRTINIYTYIDNDNIGDYIGTYECADSGSSNGIKNNNVIDIWRPDLESCQEFMNLVYANGANGKVYVEILDD